MRKLLLLLGLCAMQTPQAQDLHKNVAYADNHVRFTVISDGAVRMEYAPDGQFVDTKSFVAVQRAYPAADYRVKRGAWIEIATPKMVLRYRKNSGPFTASNLSVCSPKGAAVPFVWKPGMQQKGNLKGTYRTLDGYDGDTYVYDERRPKMPIEDGLLATDGWTLIDDSDNFLFDGDKEWEWVEKRPDDGAQDWYFLAYGHDYKAALRDFTLFAGKMPLPPRYAFGYWWSRYWAYSDKELRTLVKNFRAYDIPLDVLVIDMDWHYTDGDRGGWTGWSWNRTLFPDPAKFLRWLDGEGIRSTFNLHPADGVRCGEDSYADVARDMGIDPASKQTVPWVSSDKKFIRSIFRRILTPMERDGVDFWWLDWQQQPTDPAVEGLSNTWWLNYVFFSDMEKNRDVRPMLYHRWGGLGNHRYQIGFSGDASITWASLDFQPYFNSTASNVLYGYWSHDIGGHHMADPHRPRTLHPLDAIRRPEPRHAHPLGQERRTEKGGLELRPGACRHPAQHHPPALCARTLYLHHGPQGLRRGDFALPADVLRVARGLGSLCLPQPVPLRRRHPRSAGHRAGEGGLCDREGLAPRGEMV